MLLILQSKTLRFRVTLVSLFSDKHMKWCLVRCHTPQKVYFPPVFKLLFNLMIMINKEESGKLVITSVLHKLLQTVRADKQLVQAMCREVRNQNTHIIVKTLKKRLQNHKAFNLE